MKPIGESKDEWTMFAFLAKKLQEVANREENIDKAQVKDTATTIKGAPLARDGVRRLDIFYDEYTNTDEESEEELEPYLGEDPDGIKRGDRLALEAALEKTDQFQPHTVEKMYKQGGFLQLNEKAAKNSPLYADRPYNSLENHIYRFERFETVSGRQTFYVDHPVWIKLGAATNTGREPIVPKTETYPFTIMTPHARWSIHSNYKTAKLLQRLQRGKPWIMINPESAKIKGIKDGDEVRIYNNIGEFYAMAKLTASAPKDALVMEDGWDPNFFRERKHNNVVVPPSLNLLEMSEGWGHLKFGGVWDGNQYAYDGAINFEKAKA
jgi:complex iron-sulfur molybdoenzyme family reductase subunit alpha